MNVNTGLFRVRLDILKNMLHNKNERMELNMNKRRVLTCAGGGGEPLNPIYNGRNIIYFEKNSCSSCDNVTKFDGQY